MACLCCSASCDTVVYRGTEDGKPRYNPILTDTATPMTYVYEFIIWNTQSGRDSLDVLSKTYHVYVMFAHLSLHPRPIIIMSRAYRGLPTV